MPWRAFVQVTKGVGMKEVGGADRATTTTDTATALSFSLADAADAAVDVAIEGSLPQIVREQPWALAKRFRHQPDRRTMSLAIMQYISRVIHGEEGDLDYEFDDDDNEDLDPKILASIRRGPGGGGGESEGGCSYRDAPRQTDRRGRRRRRRWGRRGERG